MEKLFNFFDELKKSYEAEMLSSNHNRMKDLQFGALEQYQRMPVPNPREKTWSKLANVEIGELPLRMAPKPEVKVLKNKNQSIDGEVRINEDMIEYRLDDELRSKGVVLCDLATAAEAQLELLKSIIEKNSAHFDKIAAITTGISRHGFLLYIPKDIKVERPIEVITRFDQSQTILPISGYVVLDQGASATLFMRSESKTKGDAAALASMNLLVNVGESAMLHFGESQKLGEKVWYFVNEKFMLERQANLEYLLLDEGSKVNKHNLSIDLTNEGSQATITGIYRLAKDQLYIYDTQQIHEASHSNSDLLFSGVLDDDAYSMWKGNVYVAEGTKGADGFQINKNLLLNEDAHVESIPGLEIIADDVRCSHAVTLSSVDPEQIFYLQTRGISTDEAQKLVVNGFLEAASMRIKDENLLKLVKEELN